MTNLETKVKKLSYRNEVIGAWVLAHVFFKSLSGFEYLLDTRDMQLTIV
jgi:hypothetical protein